MDFDINKAYQQNNSKILRHGVVYDRAKHLEAMASLENEHNKGLTNQESNVPKSPNSASNPTSKTESIQRAWVLGIKPGRIEVSEQKQAPEWTNVPRQSQIRIAGHRPALSIAAQIYVPKETAKKAESPTVELKKENKPEILNKKPDLTTHEQPIQSEITDADLSAPAPFENKENSLVPNKKPDSQEMEKFFRTAKDLSSFLDELESEDKFQDSKKETEKENKTEILSKKADTQPKEPFDELAFTEAEVLRGLAELQKEDEAAADKKEPDLNSKATMEPLKDPKLDKIYDDIDNKIKGHVTSEEDLSKDILKEIDQVKPSNIQNRFEKIEIDKKVKQLNTEIERLNKKKSELGMDKNIRIKNLEEKLNKLTNDKLDDIIDTTLELNRLKENREDTTGTLTELDKSITKLRQEISELKGE